MSADITRELLGQVACTSCQKWAKIYVFFGLKCADKKEEISFSKRLLLHYTLLITCSIADFIRQESNQEYLNSSTLRCQVRSAQTLSFFCNSNVWIEKSSRAFHWLTHYETTRIFVCNICVTDSKFNKVFFNHFYRTCFSLVYTRGYDQVTVNSLYRVFPFLCKPRICLWINHNAKRDNVLVFFMYFRLYCCYFCFSMFFRAFFEIFIWFIMIKNQATRRT